MRARRLGVAMLVVLFFVSTHVAVAADGRATTVTPAGDLLKLTVHIDAILPEPAGLREEVLAWLADLATSAENYWNEGFKGRRAGCFRLELDVSINPIGWDGVETGKTYGDGGIPYDFYRTDSGRHVIAVMPDEYFPSLVLTPGPPDGKADFSGSYTGPSSGVFSYQLENARDMAHEIGHLLGLGDDYREGGDSKPGREGTLMTGQGDGDLIDQDLIDRIAKQIDAAGELPACETWQGTIHADHQVPQSGCAWSWDGAVKATVVGEVVHGTADVTPTVVTGGDCAAEPGPVEFGGTAAPDEWQLTSNSFLFDTAVLGRAGTKVAGGASYRDGYNQVESTMKLVCTNCGEAR